VVQLPPAVPLNQLISFYFTCVIVAATWLIIRHTMRRSDQQCGPRSDRRTGMPPARNRGAVQVPEKTDSHILGSNGSKPAPSPVPGCLLSPGADMVRERTVGHAAPFCLGRACESIALPDSALRLGQRYFPAFSWPPGYLARNRAGFIRVGHGDVFAKLLGERN
jgi:hypothetical protein